MNNHLAALAKATIKAHRPRSCLFEVEEEVGAKNAGERCVRETGDSLECGGIGPVESYRRDGAIHYAARATENKVSALASDWYYMRRT